MRSGGSTKKSNSALDSALATSSNASSELSVNNSHFFDGIETEVNYYMSQNLQSALLLLFLLSSTVIYLLQTNKKSLESYNEPNGDRIWHICFMRMIPYYPRARN
ncbi:uncharacterized protein [Euphorbia lathyris]|uniref:uncharacterized protein n=1 Tax=Euphorbia lathyris TaxID=212925 RepID=UPI0033140EB4